MAKNWYVVHTYAGFENKVKAGILETVVKLGLQDRISQILVPTEEVLSLKGGKNASPRGSSSRGTSSWKWIWTIRRGTSSRTRPR